MRRILILAIIVTTLFIFPAETETIMNFSLDEPRSGLAGNSMGDIVYDGEYIWIGTGDGLSYSSDGGETWFTYDNNNGLNSNDISALAVFDSTLWVACAYTKMIEGEPIPFGNGFNKTTNRGKEWESFIPKQVDFAGEIVYDIAFDDTRVWAACWYGGLIHGWMDNDTMIWENVFVSEAARIDYDSGLYEHLDNRFFSVVVDTFCPKDKRLKNSINDIVYDGRFLWVGTQNGLQVTEDDGDTWLTYDTSNGLNANGVHALTGFTSFSDDDNASFLCVGVYSGEKEYELPLLPALEGEGFNYTSDYGFSWDTSLTVQAIDLEKFAYDIAIADTLIWAVCGKGGLIRSFDWGENWENVFVDANAEKRYKEGNLLDRDIFISIAVDTFSQDTPIIWAGTKDGLYKFIDSPGYATATDWIEAPVVHASSPEVNKVIIPNRVYERFGYGDWVPPDSIIVDDFCYPYQGIDPGDFFEIPIILKAFQPEYRIGGFLLEVQFDYINLTFIDVERGALLSKRWLEPYESNPTDTVLWRWEYFSYRVMPCAEPGCRKYKILLYGQAEMPDGPYRRGYCLNPENNVPETHWAVDSAKYYHNGQVEWVEVGATLVWLKFQIANNELLRDQTLPIVFEWEHKLSPDPPHEIIEDWDCAENTMSSCDMVDLYVSKNPLQYEPDVCGESQPEGGAIYPILDFMDGGVYICASDTPFSCIRGDIDLNGVAYEIADAILFAHFFVYGLSVFTIDQDAQGCATDVNADGRHLMLADLVYLIRVIHHDAVPYPVDSPSSDTAGFINSCGRITVECASPIGALLFEFDGVVTPTLLNAEMEILFNEGKVLVWSREGNSIPPGASHILTVTGAELVSVTAADREGRDLATTIITKGELCSNSVLALGIQKYDQNKIIWASACSEEVDISSCSTYKSTDGGETWTSYLGGVWVRDFAFQGSAVWAATNEGLKMTRDGGTVWDNFEIPDTLRFSIPSNFTSVCLSPSQIDTVIDTIIWVGAMDGLAKFKDDTRTWEVIKFAQSFKKAIWAGSAAGIFKFIYNYRDVFDTVLNYNSYEHGITGDFVVSTAIQKYDDRKIIWAGTQPTYSGGNGVSKSTDDGETWSVTLEGDRVWNFAFDDSVVWAATSSGLKRSSNGGERWDIFNYMKDKEEVTEDGIFSTEFTSVVVIDGEVWAGNADGLVRTQDNGNTWNVFRTAVPIGSKGSETAYAYPSPFSPVLSTGGVVRIHYKPQRGGPVTIKIYDFAMNLVTTLVDNQDRIGGEEYDEPWNGKNENGDVVANGVYFFKVEAPGGQTECGKLVILK